MRKILFILLMALSINKIALEQIPSEPKIKDIIIILSAKYNIDPKIVNAFFFVESKHNVAAANKRTRDYGIAQINIRNIKRLGLNKERLLRDPYYSIEQGIKIIVYFKNRYEAKLGYTWVAKYNCGVKPGCEKTKKSKKYIKKLYASL
jgi:soluble lytic murein transglycosylase-like protein